MKVCGYKQSKQLRQSPGDEIRQQGKGVGVGGKRDDDDTRGKSERAGEVSAEAYRCGGREQTEEKEGRGSAPVQATRLKSTSLGHAWSGFIQGGRRGALGGKVRRFNPFTIKPSSWSVALKFSRFHPLLHLPQGSEFLYWFLASVPVS